MVIESLLFLLDQPTIRDILERIGKSSESFDFVCSRKNVYLKKVKITVLLFFAGSQTQ